MAQHEPFHFDSLEQLLSKARELGLDLPFSENVDLLLQPLTLAGRKLANRLAIHPMEGFDADHNGRPGELAFRRYQRYAEGGSSLIWFEATAVVPEARSNPHQFYLHPGSLDTFKRLVESTRRQAYRGQELVLILQLTHSGRYSKPEGKPRPIIAHHSPVLDPPLGLPSDYPLIGDDELDALQERFVEAARLAAEAGFDGVDIKACHRYLVSELHASFTRENSRYGGTFENRTRFLRETAAQIRREVPSLFVTTRLNVYDAIPYPYGFGVARDGAIRPDLTEPLELVQGLIDLGIPILNVSMGNPYFNPHVGRPYDKPIVGLNPPQEHPLEGVARLIHLVGEVQKAFPNLPVVGTGYSWLRHYFPFVAAGVVERGLATLIGQGRGAFAYPDSVRDLIEKGKLQPRKTCVACSACTQIMRDGGQTGCVIRDNAVYGPEYRRHRRVAPDVLRNEADRCWDCAFAMCQAACPVHLDIPGFIKAYGRGDLERAYAILMDRNPLSEVCALVCPVEVLCEGACVENLLNLQPVGIARIQRAIAREARERKLPPFSLPPTPTGQYVAVIGAGPAGLACAAQLLKQGHHVTLYDRDTAPGGLPRTVIPNERVLPDVVEAEIQHLFSEAERARRLHFAKQELDATHPLHWFLKRHQAIFLGLGLQTTQQLPTATQRPEGVEDALSFLRRLKGARGALEGATVAVLGGGATAMDAATVALEQGARDVYLIYRRSLVEMPAWPEEQRRALERGVHFLILSQPLDYTSEDGRLTGVIVARTLLGPADDSGRRRPQVVPNSSFTLPVDVAVEALGQELDERTRSLLLSELEFEANGTVKVDEDFRTSLRGVFAGGDLVNGGSTVVQAVAEGLRAAGAIDRYLNDTAGSRPNSAKRT